MTPSRDKTRPKKNKNKKAGTPDFLEATDVYATCDPSSFSFSSTAEVDELSRVIGQDRAVSAVEFGIEMDSGGYNIYALGPTGTGKASTITQFLHRQAPEEPTPADWVYVTNFHTPHRPRAIQLPAGHGDELKKDMEKLIDDLQAEITQAFEGEEYEKKRREIAQQVSDQQENKLDALREKANEQGFTMVRTPAGLAFAPKTEDDETMSREQYGELPEEEQKEIDDGISALNEELQQVMTKVRREERSGRESLRALDREVTTYAAKHLIDELKEKWDDFPMVTEHLDAVLSDVVDNAEDFKQSEDDQTANVMGMALSARQRSETTFRRYQVNVIVNCSELEGAPVVEESNPTLQNLVGRIEHQAQFGALVTDFNMIKAGALHRANGGYLLLEAHDVLLKPYSWDALKRTLKTGEIRVEDLAQQIGMATTATLDPEPIPLTAKIVLIGEPYLYYLLHALDPDFQELFGVKADFDTTAERNRDNEDLYARFVGQVCRQKELPHFTPEGVARVVEHGSRLVTDQQKLSVRFIDVVDLIQEAAFWARRRNGGADGALVHAEDVQTAVRQRIYRSNRVEERLQEMIVDGTIMVDTAGEAVGQINALVVLSMGDYSFGRPTRITATTRLGDGEVVDIEREVEMGGPIHSKGVLILSGYLGAKYAADAPMSLAARLVFEQSYSEVEGDSASSAELYAILSSLSGLPLRQDLAVTGSVNQHGSIQPIGGVNEKIEGFFAICKARGLTGSEGVLIPRTNVRNLMLNEEVREAMAAGDFHIYPVSTIDEGISILTGVEAGEPGTRVPYPKGTVNRLVADRLAELAEKRRGIAGKDSGEHDGN